MIIWLSSYPRSGNTYFRMLLYHLYGIKTYSVYSEYIFEKNGIANVVGHKEGRESILNLEKTNNRLPFFVKTHELPKKDDHNYAIYLVRDGRDALVSYAKYIIAFNQQPFPFHPVGKLQMIKEKLGLSSYYQRVLKELIVSDFLGGWSQNVLSWSHHNRESRTIVVRYEDLVADPLVEVQRCLDFLEIKFELLNEFLPNFSKLHKKWPNFFRKGKVGGWRDEMPSHLHSLFWKHHIEAMKKFGYQ